MTQSTTITPTGIAVALAVIVALGFLFLGSNVFGLFSPQPGITEGVAAPNENAALMTNDTIVGTGAEAVPGSTVTVHYVGTFENGQVFDASTVRGEPFTFVLGAGQVIAGWDQGVAGMKVGGKRQLAVPPELGYGMNDYGPIPGGSTLYFEVELLDVK